MALTLSSFLKSLFVACPVLDICLNENMLQKTSSINACSLEEIKRAYLKHRNLKDLFLGHLWVFCLPQADLWALLHTSHNPKC